MGDDAREPLLNVHSTLPPEQMKAVLAELAERVAAIEAEGEERKRRVAELLGTSGDPRVPPRARRKRDRHGLHIVRGVPLAAAGGWLVRHHAHRVAGIALAAAVGTAAAVDPSLMAQAPAAHLPAAAAVHHSMRHRHREIAVMPAVVPGRRKRRHNSSDPTVRPRASVTPSAPPSPEPPSPTPTVAPTPLPTPSPLPTPVPTCTLLTGKHCHGGVVVTAQALRALTGLS